MRSQTSASHSVVDPEHHVDGHEARSLWRVAVLIMAIVFGPAMVAWVLTLIH
jgi:hypothetical protein